MGEKKRKSLTSSIGTRWAATERYRLIGNKLNRRFLKVGWFPAKQGASNLPWSPREIRGANEWGDLLGKFIKFRCERRGKKKRALARRV